MADTSKELEGRQVVITGGRGGLGGAVVDAFVAAGARCHLPERGAGEAPARPGVQVAPGVDLTNEAAVEAFYRGLPALWASVHLAGGFAAAPLLRTSLGDLRAQVDVNLTTAFLCCREAVRKMASGGGRIVNASSRAALVPAGGSLAYTAAKGALTAFTRALAEEVRPQGILVNAVAPWIIDTPANRAAMPTADHSRWTRPADLARLILWLASPANAVTWGAIVPVPG
jgi:NAD(P)-dependent dehydrogenase (short-subunit alcohol dehydrogenase family)